MKTHPLWASSVEADASAVADLQQLIKVGWMELLSSPLIFPVLLNDEVLSMAQPLNHRESGPALAQILVQNSKANWILRRSSH